MNGILYIGATGLEAHQSAIDTVANNISNMNTTAYKRGSVVFSELLAPGATSVGGGAQSHRATPAGVVAHTEFKQFADGDLQPTDNPLDLAIRGDGFIPLASAQGETLLWRGGMLHVDADGYLATNKGHVLEARISVPRDAASVGITSTGTVQAIMPGGAEPLNIGQIDLVRPANLGGLQSVGDATYRLASSDNVLTTFQPGEDGVGVLAQGYIEGSNVQLSDELVSLMVYQRAYAANARLVQVGDELMAIANGLKR